MQALLRRALSKIMNNQPLERSFHPCQSLETETKKPQKKDPGPGTGPVPSGIPALI